MPKREAKKSRAQEDKERAEAEEAEAAAAAAPAPAKAAEDSDEDDGSEDSDDEPPAPAGDGPKAEDAAPARPQITPPASMADIYKSLLATIQSQGEGFKGHQEYPEISERCEVEYCSICSLPPDFCQYGPCWDRCKPLCMEKFPYYYPDLVGGDLGEAKKKADVAEDKSKTKQLPGGKEKRSKSPRVVIKKLTRGGRKCITSIAGLEGFGVKPEVAAKLFKKKFACGSAPVKGEPGQPDTVDIQGDFEEEVIDLIVENFKEVARSKIKIEEGGTKKAGKK